MGNVRSEKVKSVARELIKRYPGKFTSDFEENKRLIESLANIPSKKLRNTVVGYVTRLAVLSQPGETRNQTALEKTTPELRSHQKSQSK